MSKYIEVSICCMTYNQEKYICKMLDSMLEQETEFSFEILIHDDASTDNTPKIIREYANRYPDIIVPILQTVNQFSLGKENHLFDQLIPRARGKYIAACEGDDYWCNVDKIQKQRDFLENHKNCTICSHKTEIIAENGEITGRYIPSQEVAMLTPGDEYLKSCLEKDSHFFHTSSIFFRKKDVENILQNQPKFVKITPVEDRALFWYLATQGSIGYIDNTMSCYREMSMGSWSRAMVSSKEKTHKKNCSILEMAAAFEKYTGGRFHKEFYELETMYNFRIFQHNLDCKEIKSERYSALYNNLSRKEKFFFTFCLYFPQIGKLYRNIKKIILENYK